MQASLGEAKRASFNLTETMVRYPDPNGFFQVEEWWNFGVSAGRNMFISHRAEQRGNG